MKKLLVVLLAMMVLGAGLVASADESVQVNAEIGAKLIFNIVEGEEVLLEVDPVDSPMADGETSFEVKTNAPYYNITASFGAFSIGDYDLIENENFKIKSETAGDGETLTSRVVPQANQEVLVGESGFTNSEWSAVYYHLGVDFTVPSGEACTTVVFTASMSL